MDLGWGPIKNTLCNDKPRYIISPYIFCMRWSSQNPPGTWYRCGTCSHNSRCLKVREPASFPVTSCCASSLNLKRIYVDSLVVSPWGKLAIKQRSMLGGQEIMGKTRTEEAEGSLWNVPDSVWELPELPESLWILPQISLGFKPFVPDVRSRSANFSSSLYLTTCSVTGFACGGS